ncbi:hypothetical protein HFN20_09080 [Paenibacillus dendritiformis]|uniref:hypothetical protein n=1 Tax=Paenibacillus dendritiformis TaxID=130049 RepID=UPI00143D9FE3|nr:hypothetical protein [Paenibacillus dendritiformis]NKI21372.1 hypothetical protein [Paenibacillus dendritiformis]NRG00351.1 hypothetical protein [Paenibacillus dendritiformis]
MIYGVHTKLVDEVIQFANSMKNIPNREIPQDILVTNEYEEAKKYAIYEVYGEDEYTWSDIRQLEMAKVKGKIYRLEPAQKPVGLGEITGKVEAGLRENITDSYSDFFENVLVDLRNCALNRAVNGQNDNFYEKVFQIYKAGGFPCGWKGDYPQSGIIIAYFA